MFDILTFELKIGEIEQQPHCDRAKRIIYFKYKHEMCRLCVPRLCTIFFQSELWFNFNTHCARHFQPLWSSSNSR